MSEAQKAKKSKQAPFPSVTPPALGPSAAAQTCRSPSGAAPQRSAPEPGGTGSPSYLSREVGGRCPASVACAHADILGSAQASAPAAHRPAHFTKDEVQSSLTELPKRQPDPLTCYREIKSTQGVRGCSHGQTQARLHRRSNLAGLSARADDTAQQNRRLCGQDHQRRAVRIHECGARWLSGLRSLPRHPVRQPGFAGSFASLRSYG